MAKTTTAKRAVEALSEKQASAEHARLAREIAAHDRRYYQDDAPTVSDADYDALRRRYGEIEARFPKVLRKVAGYNLDHLGPPHANAGSPRSQAT